MEGYPRATKSLHAALTNRKTPLFKIDVMTITAYISDDRKILPTTNNVHIKKHSF